MRLYLKYIRQFLRRSNNQFNINLPDVVSIHDASVAKDVLVNDHFCAAYADLYDYNQNATPVEISRSYYPKRVLLLRDVLVWPEFGIACTTSGKLIAETLPSHYRLIKMIRSGLFKSEYSIKETWNKDTKQENYISSIGCGYWYSNYYHILIDELPKLHALERPSDLNLDEIRIYLPSYYSNDIYDLAKLLAPTNAVVRNAYLERNSIIYASLYAFVPSLSEDYCGYLPDSYWLKLDNTVMTYVNGHKSKYVSNNIFISRELSAKRNITNENKLVEGVLSKYGFSIYKLETLSLKDQICAFLNANFVIGAHGSGLTNIAFSKNTKIIELFPSSPVAHYRWLSASRGHNYGCVTPINSKLSKNANFDVDIDMVEKIINQLNI